MTLLYLWAQEMSFEMVNNAQVIDGATFDHNINVAENYLPDEYLMADGHKKIEWYDDLPHGRLNYHTWRYATKFNALHFQGQYMKQMMKEYRG